ncbi:MAG: DUF429 domain-containing protein [Methanolobus sp.]|uniref:DUF429 domain-containing protein n=1 Tax=Methanolobus sp. TaxID=1874737 RepID=UPI00272F3095|nr:DUF429 domain-containing protein [Methanolobus sp.]MDP2215778.1 DUF429 domain-containing protein [Methanolobus sp.]
MNVVGVDGCSSGWFAIQLLSEEEFDIGLYPNISAIWDRYRDASHILIDTPIGLREDELGRQCDRDARKKLGQPRGSSVFNAPCRQAAYELSYERASEINRKYTSKGLSKQSFAIAPKIREVDLFLSENVEAQSTVLEIHPELCFYMLSGKPMVFSKKTSEGFKERIEVLRNIYSGTDEIVNQALSKFKGKDVAKDDILDALVAALTAKLGCECGLRSIPLSPEIDSKGLPMRMMYFYH